MNYRHAFHAGNFADVMKHALMARILAYLQQKETPFFVLDTHGGCGLYDLNAEEAARTGEWRDGIARLDQPLDDGAAEALLTPYRDALAQIRAHRGAQVYPGSPLIAAEFLRAGDRGLAVELHPVDARRLRGALEPRPLMRALALDGWTALHANIPPKERRGLILIDPPYEAPDEFQRLAQETARAWAKWPTGIYALWYPVKDMKGPDGLTSTLEAAGVRKMLRLELLIDTLDDSRRLNGCGLLVINPPWTLAAEAENLLPALAARLARGPQAGFRCEALAMDETAAPKETVASRTRLPHKRTIRKDQR